MNLLAKLGLIYDDQVNENEVNKQKAEEKPVEKKTVLPDKNTFKSPDIITSSTGVFDQGIFDKLSKAIEDNNLKGNDFLEFLKALNGLSSMQIDDNTKFNMVYATLSNSSEGMTKEQLVTSIAHYLNVLENEKTLFEKEIQKVLEDKVNKNIQTFNDNESLIKTKLADIERLKGEIENLKQSNLQLNLNVNEIKSKVENKKANFYITYNSLISKIKSYEEKIQSFIK
jgi:hypothetical protein